VVRACWLFGVVRCSYRGCLLGVENGGHGTRPPPCRQTGRKGLRMVGERMVRSCACSWLRCGYAQSEQANVMDQKEVVCVCVCLLCVVIFYGVARAKRT
jgi:hypothetical protein